ncbi:hypothetical protein D3C76_1574550 [compost metagenome]
MAQRGLDGREEPRARRFVFGLAQLRAGAEQPVVGPLIVQGLGQEIVHGKPHQDFVGANLLAMGTHIQHSRLRQTAIASKLAPTG